MTCHWHFITNSWSSWNSLVCEQNQAKQELLFWRDKLRTLNGILFWQIPFVSSKILFTDPLSTGCGGFIQDSALVCHKNWFAEESQKSSTWRKLAAISQAVSCNTDNQNVVRIIQAGSMVKEWLRHRFKYIPFYLPAPNSPQHLLAAVRPEFSG